MNPNSRNTDDPSELVPAPGHRGRGVRAWVRAHEPGRPSRPGLPVPVWFPARTRWIFDAACSVERLDITTLARMSCRRGEQLAEIGGTAYLAR